MELKNEIERLLSKNSHGLKAISDDVDLRKVLFRSMELILSWDLEFADQKSLSTVDYIFGFAFGQGENSTPGAINAALAYAISQLNIAKSIPIYAQWEIADELTTLGITTDFIAKPVDGYLDSFGVLEQFLTGMPDKDKTILLITHPDHQYRCGELAKYAGLSVLFSNITTLISSMGWESFGCDKDGYWANSSQAWTRSRKAYLKHELVARIVHNYRDQIS